MKRKIFSILLSMIMVFSLCFQPVHASVYGFDFSLTGKPAGNEVKTINLNAAMIRPDSTWSIGGNLVYFGKYGGNPVAYRVLSSPNTQSTTSDSLLLDCNTSLEAMIFTSSQSNQWTDSGCTVRSWLNGNDFYDNVSVFTTLEKAAIVETQLHEQNEYFLYPSGEVPINSSNEYDDYSATAKVFCLSAAEADGLYSGIAGQTSERYKTGSKDYWWLRSTPTRRPETVCIVTNGNSGISWLEGVIYGATAGVSPALNLDLSKVLFASESGTFKASTAGALSQVNTSTATKWKLTLLDSSKTVRVTSGQSVVRSDAGGSTTITVPYTYTDNNSTYPATQISFMITDKRYTDSNAQVLYYGALENTTITNGGASGIGTLILPTELVDKCESDYYAYIIAEDVNGGQETDYASKPSQILKYTASVTNGTLSGGNTTGDYIQGKTVTITANAAPAGQQFKEWTVENGNITLASTTSATTTFTMPAEEVSVKAVYEDRSIPNTTYQIIDGTNASWTLGSSEGLTIRGSGEFSKYTGVKIDGNLIDQSNYTAKEGSTIITLSSSYLNTLATGTHTAEILWTDGSASTTFIINEKYASPKTGDNTQIVWMFILSGLSGTGMILTRKKGKKNLKTSGE